MPEKIEQLALVSYHDATIINDDCAQMCVVSIIHWGNLLLTDPYFNQLVIFVVLVLTKEVINKLKEVVILQNVL